MNLKNWLCIVLVFLACSLATASSAEDPAELHQKGVAALKDSQTNPDAIVLAARCFAKASALYEANGKSDLAVEMNSYLYYCKKKMTMKDIDTFLKGEETTVSARLTAVENKPAAPSEARAYLDRADAFAHANPGEHLLAAARYFEVADRFKNTDPGRIAMGKSLAEMQQISTEPIARPKSAATVAADMDRAESENKAAVEAARKIFLSKLQIEMVDATKRGDLDGALKIKERIKQKTEEMAVKTPAADQGIVLAIYGQNVSWIDVTAKARAIFRDSKRYVVNTRDLGEPAPGWRGTRTMIVVFRQGTEITFRSTYQGEQMNLP